MSKTTMRVDEIVRRFIKAEGHDGLCDNEIGCGCSMDDFALCGDGPFPGCVVATNTGPHDGCDEWYVPVIQEWPEGVIAALRAVGVEIPDEEVPR